MHRPPRDPNEPLFSFARIAWSLIQGTIVLAFVAGLFVIALGQGLPEADARALTFAALVATNLGLVLVNRSRGPQWWRTAHRKNVALWCVAGATSALLAFIVAFAPARDLFHFGPLHADDIAIACGSGVAVLLLLGFGKRLAP